MFSFEKSITINRTPHEVFTFIANPANMPKWRKDVSETKFVSTPMQIGDKVTEVLNPSEGEPCVVEVIGMIADRKIILKSVSGTDYLPLRIMTFAVEGEHTKFTIHVSAHTDGFTRLIEPISSNAYSIKWENYLFALKEVLEAA